MRTLEACSGTYISQLDGDDFFTSPSKLRTQADYLDEHTHRVGWFTAFQDVDGRF